MFGFIVVLLIAALIAAIWAFGLGIGALRRVRYSPGRRSDWLLLALLLCEPLLSALLMSWIFMNDWAWSSSGIATALWLTAPMAVLLLTLLGLRSPIDTERQRRIALLGVGRWGMVLLAALALFHDLLPALLPPALLLGSVVLLWHTATWGRGELRAAAVS